ncbi:hypothetical protein [Actinophytocola sp.]|uniref:hypothetical protein n=1 Tax=Actinophytocola sp. TaxID=1872138 RepID=UPI002ED04C7B
METTTASDQTAKPRRRVRVAHQTLDRVRGERETFDTEYGKARTAQERFAATSTVLRAAAAEGRHQPDPEDVARRLDRITDAMKELLAELHQAQQAKAEQTIRADERRIARNERRRG